MKTQILVAMLFAIFCAFPKLHAQAPEFSWAHSWGNVEFDVPPSMTTGPDGSIYVAGSFKGTVDFDPGPGNKILTSGFGGFGTDAYYCKYDTSGALLWAFSIFGGQATVSMGAAIFYGPNDVIHIVGNFDGDADFNPGPGIFNLSSTNSSEDIFLLRLSPDGDFVSAQKFGGNGHEYPKSIAIDDDGNLIIGGFFTGTSDFDPGPGENIFTADVIDLFLVKLDNNRNFVWAKEFSGNFQATVRGIVTDLDGNVYTVGAFDDFRDFDPGPAIDLITATGAWDIFIVKLNAAGEYQWVKHLHNAGDNWAHDVIIDTKNGSLYVAGHFSATLDFDPGPDSLKLTATNSDPYVLKLDLDGNIQRVAQFAGVSFDQARSITMDAQGNLYITGYYGDVVDFDPGPEEYLLTSTGNNDMDDAFAVKLNSEGEFVWAYTLGGLNNDFGTSVRVDAFGNILLTGSFMDTGGFYPGNGQDSLLAAGSADAFLVRWRQQACGPLYPTVSLSGETLTSVQTSGTYQWVDCDNGFTLVPGATNQNFTPTTSGNYSVILSDRECADTSACVNVMIVAVHGHTRSIIPTLYPNPSNGKWVVQIQELNTDIDIQVVDLSGRVVYSTKVFDENIVPIDLDVPSGIYVVKVNFDGKQYILKAVVMLE